MIGMRTNKSGVDEIVYTLGDIRGSTSVTIKRGTLGVGEQQWYGTYGNKRAGNLAVTSRGYIGQTSDGHRRTQLPPQPLPKPHHWHIPQCRPLSPKNR
jgi:hypothetical protein